MKKSKLCIAIAASLFAVNAAATDVKQELSLLKQQNIKNLQQPKTNTE